MMAPMTTQPDPDKPSKTARLHQRIRRELKQKLQREARRRMLDETAIVTIALTEYFERHGEPPAVPGEETLDVEDDAGQTPPKKRVRKTAR